MAQRRRARDTPPDMTPHGTWIEWGKRGSARTFQVTRKLGDELTYILDTKGLGRCTVEYSPPNWPITARVVTERYNKVIYTTVHAVWWVIIFFGFCLTSKVEQTTPALKLNLPFSRSQWTQQTAEGLLGHKTRESSKFVTPSHANLRYNNKCCHHSRLYHIINKKI